MPATVKFDFNKSKIIERVAIAVVMGLEDTGAQAHEAWEMTAPVSTDPRTSGDLKRMFDTNVHATARRVKLTLRAFARHAKFVEFGTIKGDPAQAPMRRTAAAVVYNIADNIRSHLGGA